MENQLLYFKRGGSEQFKQGETPSQTLTLSAANFGDLTDFAKSRFTVKVTLAAAKDRTKIGSAPKTPKPHSIDFIIIEFSNGPSDSGLKAH